MPLQFVRYDDSAEFLRHTESFLLESEAENSLTLGVAAMLASGSSADYMWAAVSYGGKIVGTAFGTPPYKLVVTEDLITDMQRHAVADHSYTEEEIKAPKMRARMRIAIMHSTRPPEKRTTATQGFWSPHVEAVVEDSVAK